MLNRRKRKRQRTSEGFDEPFEDYLTSTLREDQFENFYSHHIGEIMAGEQGNVSQGQFPPGHLPGANVQNQQQEQ